MAIAFTMADGDGPRYNLTAAKVKPYTRTTVGRSGIAAVCCAALILE